MCDTKNRPPLPPKCSWARVNEHGNFVILCPLNMFIGYSDGDQIMQPLFETFEIFWQKRLCQAFSDLWTEESAMFNDEGMDYQNAVKNAKAWRGHAETL